MVMHIDTISMGNMQSLLAPQAFFFGTIHYRRLENPYTRENYLPVDTHTSVQKFRASNIGKMATKKTCAAAACAKRCKYENMM